VLSPNLRETISADGLNSRQRAELLVLRQLIEAGELPPLDSLRMYVSEAVTPFARYLQARVPHIRCSEYLPEPDHWLRGKVPHRDIRRTGLPPAALQCVICNEVIEHVEGVLISRRELALALNPATIPMMTKEIIQLCADQAKIVVTASEMLASMRRNVTPTRAEVSDIANAVLDGTDAVVLSEEVANGKYGAAWNGSPTTGVKGIIQGDWGQLGAQALGALVIWTVIFGVSFAFFTIQNKVTKGGIRVSEDVEVAGLDIPEMGVAAYND
jgi:hypothetical protein